MDVSVVIVSFNTKDLLKNCLESIWKFTTGVEFEVIVVDNASTDGTVEYLEGQRATLRLHSGQEGKGQSNFKVIFSKENLGFSKGNNLGIKEAKGKYILLLNSDTVFLENTLERMVLWMEGHKEIAVASCQILDGQQRIAPTGGYLPTLRKVVAWAWFLDDLPIISKSFPSYHPHVGPIYEKEFNPGWVSGAFFMVRKEAMEKVGLLDENIFMYAEELEWCLRFRKAGYEIGYTPITKIVHYGQGSQGGMPKGAILGEFRGLKYIYGIHFNEWRQVLLGMVLDVGAFLRVILYLVKLKPEMVKIYLEALFL